MINRIIEAISASLFSEFGDAYEFYSEEITQDLKEPCFFIACLKPNRNKLLGDRYEGTHPFVIQYFPESEKKQRECNEVAERMTDCLEFITMKDDDKPIMGSNMSFQVIDGVLNFFINYNFTIRKEKVQTVMEDLTDITSVKEGG